MRRPLTEAGSMMEGHDYTIYGKGQCGRARMYAFLALITAFLTPVAQHGGLVLIRRYWRDDWDIAKVALFFGGVTALILFGVPRASQPRAARPRRRMRISRGTRASQLRRNSSQLIFPRFVR